MYEIHEVFFELSIPERMLIIAQSRQQEKEKLFKQQPAQVNRQVKLKTVKDVHQNVRKKRRDMVAINVINLQLVTRYFTAGAKGQKNKCSHPESNRKTQASKVSLTFKTVILTIHK